MKPMQGKHLVDLDPIQLKAVPANAVAAFFVCAQNALI